MGGGAASPTNPKKGHDVKYNKNYVGHPSDEPTGDDKCMYYGPGWNLNRYVK